MNISSGSDSIVAITGLGGKAFASWQIPDGSMWLRDALPKDIGNVVGVQTHVYGYRSALAKSPSTAKLKDFTHDFIVGLQEYLRPDIYVSISVCHSHATILGD